MSDIHVVLIGGRAGSGKSGIGSELSRLTGFSLYDKDTIANPLSEELLVALGSNRADRESGIYLRVRPFEYESTLAPVIENVALGNSAIVVAPFGPEFRNGDWLQQLQRHFDDAAQKPVGTHAVNLYVRDDVLKRRLEERGSPRDLEKLARWEAFVKLQGAPAADTVFTMDVSADDSPRRYAALLSQRFELRLRERQ